MRNFMHKCHNSNEPASPALSKGGEAVLKRILAPARSESALRAVDCALNTAQPTAHPGCDNVTHWASWPAPSLPAPTRSRARRPRPARALPRDSLSHRSPRSEEHTSELQSRLHLVCRLLLEKKKKKKRYRDSEIR